MNMDFDSISHSFISQQIRDHSRKDIYLQSLYENASAYSSSGHADNDFLPQLFSRQKSQFHSRLFELSLYNLLTINDIKLLPANQGPDFKFKLHNKTIWIEATSPTPSGIPEQDSQSPVRHFYHQECLLRITSAFKDKSEKFKLYIDQDIVSSDDVCIIAIDSGQLDGFGSGISQMPFVVEATYPVGPYAIHFDILTGKKTDSGHTFQDKIAKKHTSSNIYKDNFFTTDHCHISACLGAYSQTAGIYNVCMVHNAHALNILHPNILPYDSEYVASCTQDILSLKNLIQPKMPMG
ncbi:hypothetical protein NNJEOMEG_01245 [Fundidesulfovibrio magnetotacticus]|uniref:Uncharacterized protein n=1 Tax=Fundidesulfovibrio magnetotacticus TaxID=2730080 RepID=A0A6V8LL43_9BACT|nr:hypothetical protein [Fundidesulfovibrio magnetotacticus]GFK93413.1 hypothetical protein NNJEOMEG_01245 [Fundidesulfovibrio magnetotacticus]